MTIGQAGRQMAMNGELNQAAGTTAEQFVKNYFSKYVKIAKECGTNLSDCGFSDKIKPIDSDSGIDIPTKVRDLSVRDLGMDNPDVENLTSYAFTLANGYAINLFYNPTCTSDTNSINPKAPSYVCINAIYDMNGKNKPNKVGKDIGFVSVLYPDSQSIAVAPNPYYKDVDSISISWNDTQRFCTEQNDNLIAPNKDELLSMAYNVKLIGSGMNAFEYWSSSKHSSDRAWGQDFVSGQRTWTSPDNNYQYSLRCIYR